MPDLPSHSLPLPFPCPVHKLECPPLLIGCSNVVCLSPVHLQSQGCVRTLDFFSARTQNGKQADREEMFAEFDKKSSQSIGLESLTAPLMRLISPTRYCTLLANLSVKLVYLKQFMQNILNNISGLQ